MNKPGPLPYILAISCAAVAMLPLPYGLYRLIRLVVCAVALYLAFLEWGRTKRLTAWIVALGVLALVFNPLVPVHLGVNGGAIPGHRGGVKVGH